MFNSYGSTYTPTFFGANETLQYNTPAGSSTSLMEEFIDYEGDESSPLMSRKELGDTPPSSPQTGKSIFRGVHVKQKIERAIKVISPRSPTRKDPSSVRIIISNSAEGSDVFHMTLNNPLSIPKI